MSAALNSAANYKFYTTTCIRILMETMELNKSNQGESRIGAKSSFLLLLLYNSEILHFYPGNSKRLKQWKITPL